MPFAGIELGTRALRAFQLGMNVTGHNIANVNTAGYTRQRLVLEPAPEEVLGARLRVGTGVIAHTIQRLRDMLLEQRFNHNMATQSRLEGLRQHLEQVEALLQEPSEQGLHHLLTELFNAFEELSTRPDSMAVRQTVLQKATALTNAFRSLSRNLSLLKEQISQTAVARVEEVNRLAQQLASLNGKIRAAGVDGQGSNQLLDERDPLITRLSELVGARAQYAQDGTVMIFVGEHTLVQDTAFTPLPTQLDVGNRGLIDSNGNLIRLSSGFVHGLLEGLSLLSDYQSQLNLIAQTLVERFNAIHQTGYDLDGNTGRLFFEGTSAADIRLHSDVSDPRAIAASANGAPGNGEIAQALAKLREEPQAALGNLSITGSYRSLVNRIGSDTQTYKNAEKAQKSIMEHLQNLRESVSGVSLDEEAAQLVRYQRSYQAAAKLVSTFDSIIENLLSMVG